MDPQIEQQLEKILPEDLARTFESAYHVFQGNHEHIDDLLKNGGTLLRKAAHKFTPTQLILSIAGLAVAAVVIISRTQDHDDHDEDHSHDAGRQNRPKLSQGQGSKSKGKDQSKDQDQHDA